MSTSDLKSEAHRLIDTLPDNASWEDIMFQIHARLIQSKGMETVRDRLIMAFRQWMALQPKMIKLGFEGKPIRSDICKLLADQWNKAAQDFSSMLHLLETDHVGSAHVLIRVLMENAMRMYIIASSPHEMDEPHIYWMRNKKVIDEADHLVNNIKRVLNKYGSRFNDTLKSQLQSVVKSAQEIKDGAFIDREKTKITPNLVPSQLVERLLELNDDLDDTVGSLILSYWMESETVHSGFFASHMYDPSWRGPDEKTNFCVEALSHLRDLRYVAFLVGAAILKGFGLVNKVPLAPEVQQLGALASIAEQCLHQYWMDRHASQE